jgi:hypothetical protein
MNFNKIILAVDQSIAELRVVLSRASNPTDHKDLSAKELQELQNKLKLSQKLTTEIQQVISKQFNIYNKTRVSLLKGGASVSDVGRDKDQRLQAAYELILKLTTELQTLKGPKSENKDSGFPLE